MLNLYEGLNTIHLTLREKETIASPNYIFVFTHRTTNDVVSILRLNSEDISTNKDRLNTFTIDTHVLGTTGQYQYDVYQTSGTDTNITGKILLETGIAIYHESALTYITKPKDNEYIYQQ